MTGSLCPCSQPRCSDYILRTSRQGCFWRSFGCCSSRNLSFLAALRLRICNLLVPCAWCILRGRASSMCLGLRRRAGRVRIELCLLPPFLGVVRGVSAICLAWPWSLERTWLRVLRLISILESCGRWSMGGLSRRECRARRSPS